MNLMTVAHRAKTFALVATCAAVFGGLPLLAHAQLDKASTDALESYFEFSDYNSGTLMPEQILAEDYKRLHVVDVRDAVQFSQGHIPGAVNIEWRQVFAQRAKLPKDKTLLLYCNTSSFAAQVAMALRIDGFENVRLLYGGYNEWRARGGLDAHARAGKKG